MALSSEQNATLQLVLERGQSYESLAQLLGGDEDTVRNRARAALTELAGTDPDRNVGLTDYLLGQADPIGRADAVRHLRDDPEDHRLASELSETLRTMYPNAELPRLPGEARQPRRVRKPAAGAEAASVEGTGSGPAFSQSQTRLMVGLGAGAVLLLVVVLGITGAFGGGGDDTSTASDSGDASTTTPQTAADEGEQIEQVTLRATNGGDARGQAIFGIATADQPYVDIAIEGLDPAPQDQTYVVWLMLDGEQGYPLSPIVVNERGSFQDRFSIPSAVLQIVARVQTVDVSIAPVTEIQNIVRDAIDETALVLEKPGETVLEGKVPGAGGGAGAEGGAGTEE